MRRSGRLRIRIADTESGVTVILSYTLSFPIVLRGAIAYEVARSLSHSDIVCQ